MISNLSLLYLFNFLNLSQLSKFTPCHGSQTNLISFFFAEASNLLEKLQSPRVSCHVQDGLSDCVHVRALQVLQLQRGQEDLFVEPL